jgi:hypothetical protein
MTYDCPPVVNILTLSIRILSFFCLKARDLSLGVLYTVTEFCAGGNLADVLAQSSSSLRKNAIEARSSLRWSPQLMNNIVEGLFAAVRCANIASSFTNNLILI